MWGPAISFAFAALVASLGIRRWRRGEASARYMTESVGTAAVVAAVGYAMRGGPLIPTLVVLGMGGVVIAKVASEMRRLEAKQDGEERAVLEGAPEAPPRLPE